MPNPSSRNIASLLLPIILLSIAGPLFAQGRYVAVQLEALASQEAALRRVAELKESGVEAYLVRSEVPGKGTLFRVRVGKFAVAAEARRAGQALQSRNLAVDFFVAAWEAPLSEPASPVGPSRSAAAATPQERAPVAQTPAPTADSPRQNPSAAPRSGSSASSRSMARSSSPGVTAAPSVTAPRTYVRFTDPSIGYSFEHPQSWEGGVLASREANEQNINAGALFRSSPDRSFLNVIWNQLDQANSPDHDNDMIVELILRSMSSGDGTREMKETARRVVNANGQVRTYLDLRAKFDLPGNSSNLDFSGKAVIVRNTRGILLVVTFYSKAAPTDVPEVVDRILASVTLP
ncbi:MAG: SPOR domain-containing protein [Acidobacteriota bacterium]